MFSRFHGATGKRKLALSTALIVGAVGAVVGGAFATFTDTTTAGPQTVSSGKVLLLTGPVNDATTGATNIAAGDTIAREIDLKSTGATLPDASISLSLTASTSSLLDTDATNGLQVSIKSCSVAWTRTTPAPPPAFAYSCSGVQSTVLIGGAATASVSSLVSAPAALTTLNSVAINQQDYLVFTLTLPSTAPGDLGKVATACSGSAGGTSATENLEGCSSTITYNFIATQRAGAAQ